MQPKKSEMRSNEGIWTARGVSASQGTVDERKADECVEVGDSPGLYSVVGHGRSSQQPRSEIECVWLGRCTAFQHHMAEVA